MYHVNAAEQSIRLHFLFSWNWAEYTEIPEDEVSVGDRSLDSTQFVSCLCNFVLIDFNSFEVTFWVIQFRDRFPCFG